ncbi:MAG: hypothetical protein ACON45_12725 [Paracoccaceae bacterium]
MFDTNSHVAAIMPHPAMREKRGFYSSLNKLSLIENEGNNTLTGGTTGLRLPVPWARAITVSAH